MNGPDLVAFLKEHGWPAWAVVAVLGTLGTGRSLLNMISVLLGKRAREQNASNIARALELAQQSSAAAFHANEKADKALVGLADCKAQHNECEQRVTRLAEAVTLMGGGLVG